MNPQCYILLTNGHQSGCVFGNVSSTDSTGLCQDGCKCMIQGSAPMPSVTVGITVLFKAVSQLSLPSSQDQWGKGCRFTISPCLPAMAVNTTVLFKASQPHLLVSAEMGKGERMMPVLGGKHCFCLSYTPG